MNSRDATPFELKARLYSKRAELMLSAVLRSLERRIAIAIDSWRIKRHEDGQIYLLVEPKFLSIKKHVAVYNGKQYAYMTSRSFEDDLLKVFLEGFKEYHELCGKPASYPLSEDSSSACTYKEMLAFVALLRGSSAKAVEKLLGAEAFKQLVGQPFNPIQLERRRLLKAELQRIDDETEAEIQKMKAQMSSEIRALTIKWECEMSDYRAQRMKLKEPLKNQLNETP